MHGSTELTAGKSQKEPKKKENSEVAAALVAPSKFFLYFEEIRDHILYAALCNCNLVKLQKWATVNLLKSFSKAPTFTCSINPREIAHRCRSGERWMTREHILITICLSAIITSTVGLTRRSLGLCLLCGVPACTRACAHTHTECDSSNMHYRSEITTPANPNRD